MATGQAPSGGGDDKVTTLQLESKNRGKGNDNNNNNSSNKSNASSNDQQSKSTNQIESKENKEKENEFTAFIKGLSIDDMTDEKLEKFGNKYDTLIKMARKENKNGIIAFAVKVGFDGSKYEFEREEIATQLMEKYPKQQSNGFDYSTSGSNSDSSKIRMKHTIKTQGEMIKEVKEELKESADRWEVLRMDVSKKYYILKQALDWITIGLYVGVISLIIRAAIQAPSDARGFIACIYGVINMILIGIITKCVNGDAKKEAWNRGRGIIVSIATGVTTFVKTFDISIGFSITLYCIAVLLAIPDIVLRIKRIGVMLDADPVFKNEIDNRVKRMHDLTEKTTNAQQSKSSQPSGNAHKVLVPQPSEGDIVSQNATTTTIIPLAT